MALDPVAETRADPDSYGFRKARCCADAIEQCHNALCRRGSTQWILEGDIQACFDKINHDWLMRNVPMGEKHILRSWLKAGYLYEGAFNNTFEGTPQGGIISPTLANITLDGLEQRLEPWISRKTRKGCRAKVNYIRYADDWVITCSSAVRHVAPCTNAKELLEREILPVVTAFFAERGLTLSPEKTVITHISEGFDFLGQNVRKYGNKQITKPSKKSVHTVLEKIRTTIKGNKATSACNLIYLLNPIITGWVNYHRHICSKKTFVQIDSAIFKCLWQWAKRRHHDKNRHWIADKYFGVIGNRRWWFFGETRGAKGEQKTRNWIKHAAETPIVRHIKIRRDANPYDPAFAEYFAERKVQLKLGRRAKPILDYDGTIAMPLYSS